MFSILSLFEALGSKGDEEWVQLLLCNPLDVNFTF